MTVSFQCLNVNNFEISYYIQTRTLLDLYEKDALVMVKYFSQVTSLFDNLIASQVIYY